MTELTAAEQEQILSWIDENIISRKTVNDRISSYGLKHIMTHDTGIYVTNNQFKHAMLLKGYEPYHDYELNWQYCISSKSLAFDYKIRRPHVMG